MSNKLKRKSKSKEWIFTVGYDPSYNRDDGFSVYLKCILKNNICSFYILFETDITQLFPVKCEYVKEKYKDKFNIIEKELAFNPKIKFI